MSGAMPGLRAVDHVGLTVPDLDAAVAFYSAVFGGRELYRRGPMSSIDRPGMKDGRDWSKAHLNVAEAVWSLAMVRIAPNLMLELFQYDAPRDRNRHVPRNGDLGGHHIAFEVSDLEAAKAYLVAHRCTALEGPIIFADGVNGIVTVNYVLDPWGNQLELVEYPAASGTANGAGLARARE